MTEHLEIDNVMETVEITNFDFEKIELEGHDYAFVGKVDHYVLFEILRRWYNVLDLSRAEFEGVQKGGYISKSMRPFGTPLHYRATKKIDILEMLLGRVNAIKVILPSSVSRKHISRVSNNPYILSAIVPEGHHLFSMKDGNIWNKKQTIPFTNFDWDLIEKCKHTDPDFKGFPKDALDYYKDENGCVYYKNDLVRIENNELENYIVKDGTKNIHCKFPNSLKHVLLPEGLAAIKANNFWATSIEHIDIPQSVTFIGDSAFYKCSKLTSIFIPSSISSIERQAFEECEKLRSATICSTGYISHRAFARCKNLAKVEFTEGVKMVGHNMFEDCSSLTEVFLPKSITKIGDAAFKGCISLKIIRVPKGYTNYYINLLPKELHGSIVEDVS